jgi:hypothetical protein
MTHAEHDGSYDPMAARRSRRRKAAVGAVGLAALLGGAAFLVTDRLTGDSGTVATETGALAPVAPPSAAGPGSASPSASAVASARSGAAVSKTPSRAAAKPKTTAERVAEARGAAAKAGTRVKRPLVPGAIAAAVDESEVTTTTSQTNGETLKVMSARQNLAGFRELGWVADNGRKVGNARCSQNFRFSNNTQPRERPTLLVCWRTSAQKSVYTMAVKMDGRPSTTRSVAAIDAQWTRLG